MVLIQYQILYIDTFFCEFYFHVFPGRFQTGIDNSGKKTIQYMSGLNKHREILVLTHLYLLFGELK